MGSRTGCILVRSWMYGLMDVWVDRQERYYPYAWVIATTIFVVSILQSLRPASAEEPRTQPRQDA